MSVDLTRRIADQTWEVRLKMDELVKAGITEEDALAEIMEPDQHRETKLKVWRDRGLWPITDREREMRMSDNPPQAGVDLDPLLRVSGEERSGCNAPDLGLGRSGIAEEGVHDILAAVRVTINAAIMDYHNVQVVQMQDQIAALQERIEELEGGLRDPLPSATGKPAGHASAETASSGIDRTDTSSAAVRELMAPPRPRTVFGTREQIASQSEITARCDTALLDLFERDRQERGYDRDEMLNFVLYNFYDMPALSFQRAKRDT